MQEQFLTLIAGINSALIIALLIIYAKNLRQTPSGFTVGLALFALLFLCHNLLVLYFSLTMMPLYAPSMTPYLFTFTLLQTAAFATLNWVTWR